MVELGSRRTTERVRVGNSPPTAARAVFLPDGHVGGKEAFEEGRQDLEELAGILVKTKQVERVSERLGEQIEVAAAAERKCALGGKLLPFASVPTMYIAIDGTGVSGGSERNYRSSRQG